MTIGIGSQVGTQQDPQNIRNNMPLVVPLTLTRYLLLSLLLASVAETAFAQLPTGADQIWFQPPARSSSDPGLLPRPIEKVVGKVVKVDNGVFEVEPAAATADSTFVAHQRLVWLEPAWKNQDAAEGMQYFQNAQYAEAITSMFAGIKSGPPVWQQQWLLVHLAQAAFEAERFAPVLQLVGDFSKSRPPENFFGLLPIHWTSRGLPGTAIAEARSKIEADDPVVRLVAASWLLSSPQDRRLAESALEALSADRRNPVVSRYAEVLRWRRTSVPEIPDAAERWIQAVERLPIMLQPGPLLTIADRLQAAGESARARELFHSVALLHQRPRPLADRARRELEIANK